jgi:hypothetical protein
MISPGSHQCLRVIQIDTARQLKNFLQRRQIVFAESHFDFLGRAADNFDSTIAAFVPQDMRQRPAQQSS